MMIKVSGESPHLTKKKKFIKKLPLRKVESFLKSNFNLNQICKFVLKKEKNFNATDLLYILVKDWRNVLKSYKMSKN